MGVPNLDLTLKNGRVVSFDENGKRSRRVPVKKLADGSTQYGELFRDMSPAEQEASAQELGTTRQQLMAAHGLTDIHPRPGRPGQPALVPIAQTGGFTSFGEQLMAIKKAGELAQYGPDEVMAHADKRLFDVQRRAAASTPAGGSEIVPADGGFLVAPQFSQAILRRMYRTGEIFGRCLEMPITDPNTNAVVFPQFDEQSRANGSRWGGVMAFWQNEANTLVNTKPKFRSSKLVAQKLTGLLYLTDELATDSNALDTWATYAFSQEMLFRVEDACVNGTGATQPLGIVGAPGTITVPKVTDQAAGTVVTQNVIGMLAQLWGASQSNAIWLYNPQLLPQLMQLTTPVGTAGSEARLFNYACEEGGYNFLAGIPAVPSEYCKVPGTPGDLILADWGRYVLAMRDDSPQAAASIHVKWLSDEVCLRFTFRINGQPLDQVPLTPLNGSTQVSPMLVLAQR